MFYLSQPFTAWPVMINWYITLRQFNMAIENCFLLCAFLLNMVIFISNFQRVLFIFSEPGSEVKTDLKSHYVECTKHDVVLHNFLQRAKLLANIIFEIEMLQLHAKMMNKLEL